MAIFAVPLLWPAVVAAARAAVAITKIVVGAGTAAATISKTIEAVDKTLEKRDQEKAGDNAADNTCIKGCSRKCPPCVPPVGTIRVERIDRVPPSRPHAPCSGDHAHLVQRNQAPYPGCRCFWNKARLNVYCLGSEEPPPYPMK